MFPNFLYACDCYFNSFCINAQNSANIVELEVLEISKKDYYHTIDFKVTEVFKAIKNTFPKYLSYKAQGDCSYNLQNFANIGDRLIFVIGNTESSPDTKYPIFKVFNCTEVMLRRMGNWIHGTILDNGRLYQRIHIDEFRLKIHDLCNARLSVYNSLVDRIFVKYNEIHIVLTNPLNHSNVNIYNSLGQLIFSKKMNDHQDHMIIQAADWSSAVYFVQFEYRGVSMVTAVALTY